MVVQSDHPEHPPAGNLLAAVIGKVGVDGTGLAGVEAGYNEPLRERAGFVEPVLDARGNPLWVPPSGYAPSIPGAPVRLSIDLEIQRIVVEELERRVSELDAAGARCVVVDPETGEVLALADVVRTPDDLVEAGSEEHRRALAENRRVRVRTLKPDPVRAREPALSRVRCAVDVYEPGSTFKPFVWSMVVERGRVTPGEMLDTEGGVWTTGYGRTLRDVAERDEQSWSDVLVNSSNIGMAKGAERLEPTELREDVLRWGFGEATGLPVPGEAGGLVTSRADWTKLTQSSVPMGYEIGVTPLQMARAFSAFARAGNRAGEMPALTLEALTPGDPRLRVTQRVLRPSTAEAARGAMVEVARRMAERTPIWIPGEEPFGYSAFGKSGTAKSVSPAGGYLERQYTSSFIGAAPAEHPRLVIVVVIDDPGPEVVRAGRYFGSMTAGPCLLRIARRSLRYLGVAPDAVIEH
jgi:cell division protein FtsI (penicillin-binding protein 3)